MPQHKRQSEITARPALRESVTEVQFDGLGTTSIKVVSYAYLLFTEDSMKICSLFMLGKSTISIC